MRRLPTPCHHLAGSTCAVAVSALVAALVLAPAALSDNASTGVVEAALLFQAPSGNSAASGDPGAGNAAAAAELPESSSKTDAGKPVPDKPDASKPDASKPVSQKTKSSDAKSDVKPGEKPVNKVGEKNPEKPQSKPGEKSAGKNGEKPGEKSSEKDGGKPAGKPGEKPFDKNAPKKDAPEKSIPGKSAFDKNAPNKKTVAVKGDGLKGDDSKGDGSKDGGKQEIAKGGGKPANDEAALAFARQHHPELADLLVNLKKGNPNEYGRAIKELLVTVERLSRMREKAPERYDSAVAAWTLDSKIRLLSARLVMADNPALEAELKALLQQRREHRLQEMKQEREKVAARLKKLETDIAALEADPAAGTQKELLEVQSRLKEKAREFRRKPGKSGTPETTKSSTTKSEAKSDVKPNSQKPDLKKPEPQKPEPQKTESGKGEAK